VKLVPFGEYVPWRRWLSFAEGMMAEIGDFQPGTTFPVGMLPGGRYSVFICYEAVFPDLIRRFTRNGAGLLINLSNDGWFGHSAAAAQHLAQARVRAVENRRWLLRATNTGITASIDPYGRIVASLPIDRRTVLIAPFAFRNDVTLYNLWGDWFCWVCLLFSVVFLALGAMPREEEQEEEEQDPHAEQGKET
jgi:apolipoprotein N-acyltransferase